MSIMPPDPDDKADPPPFGGTSLRSQIIEVLPLPGEVMTAEAYMRIVDDLLVRVEGRF